MAALTSASFTSSVVTTLDSWRAFVNHDPRQVALLTGEALDRLTEGERRAYDDMRTDYHAELPALKTPILDRTVTKGLLFMTQALPPPRKIPVVPRPRHGELSGSYLARVARANRTDLRSFLALLGSLPPALSSETPDLAVMVLTLNVAAFTRLLAYTGLDGGQLIRAIPSLAPRATSAPGEPPAIRLSFVKTPATDCPGCRLRRDGAHADTRLLTHKTACLRHGYWLYGQGGGQRLNLAAIPEVAAAQRRLERVAARRGPTAAMHAYEIASGYLQHSWRIDSHPLWYPDLLERWHQRVRAAGATPASTTWQLPGWAVHPECTALAAVFASPYWAALAVPTTDRRHRLFYQRLLAELAVGGAPLRTMRIFDPLPRDIQEQARWGRFLSDPDWGAPPPPRAIAKAVPFIDITDIHERPVRVLQEQPCRQVRWVRLF